MATKTVHTGNYGSYLYIDYSFTVNSSNRTWTCNAALKIHIPSGYTFGSWNNTGANSATLQADGMNALSSGEHTLVSSRQIASGTYDDNGTAPSVNVSWAFNVNSVWGGYVNPYGTETLIGSAIETDGGKIHTKVSGSWRSGKVWIKVNGTWKKSKKVWIKVNGVWKQAK